MRELDEQDYPDVASSSGVDYQNKCQKYELNEECV